MLLKKLRSVLEIIDVLTKGLMKKITLIKYIQKELYKVLADTGKKTNWKIAKIVKRKALKHEHK